MLPTAIVGIAQILVAAAAAASWAGLINLGDPSISALVAIATLISAGFHAKQVSDGPSSP